jgi:hypothetical protein
MDTEGSSPTSGLTFHDPTSPFINGNQPDRSERGVLISRVIEGDHDLGSRDLETQSNSSNVAQAVSGDDDDWAPQMATTEIGESSESTEHQISSDESSLHPLLESHATLHRENASVSSTGATVGSAVVGEETAEPTAIEEVRATRREDLMRQMAADIERYVRQESKRSMPSMGIVDIPQRAHQNGNAPQSANQTIGSPIPREFTRTGTLPTDNPTPDR